LIDLVERAVEPAPDDDTRPRLRATDHKTGRSRASHGVVEGGATLQPVLYPLAVEKLFPGARVESGGLYYCTSRGRFQEHRVRLDERARKAAGSVTREIGGALAEGFLPAAPQKDACRFCDYLPVCGPHEERRVTRKRAIDGLARLRSLP
jgi:CRISPR/Cas system-associated exonuclease Cas4 (RecB family)